MTPPPLYRQVLPDDVANLIDDLLYGKQEDGMLYAAGPSRPGMLAAVKQKKHTPGRDHQTKSGGEKKERFQKKADQKRSGDKKDLEEAWDKWNKLRPEQQNMLPELKPNKPDPRCQ